MKDQPSFIRFVRAGEKGNNKITSNAGIMDRTNSWEMRVDIGRRLDFPDVVQTSLRPDVVVWSASSRQIIVIELTVPWEEICDEENERKSAKYAELMELCRERGWCTWLFPVEVGCRGFPEYSVWRTLKALGVVGNTRKTAVQRRAEAAERASCWLSSRMEVKD